MFFVAFSYLRLSASTSACENASAVKFCSAKLHHRAIQHDLVPPLFARHSRLGFPGHLTAPHRDRRRQVRFTQKVERIENEGQALALINLLPVTHVEMQVWTSRVPRISQVPQHL